LKNPSFIFLGYQFSRPDLPGQKSINRKDNETLDLYRHRQATSDKWSSEDYKTQGYRKIYDIYSLGVLLAEIGLWRCATNINASGIRRGYSDFHEYLPRKVKEELPVQMGQTYADAVHLCLTTGEFSVDTNDADDAALLEQFSEKVLKPLGSCKV